MSKHQYVKQRRFLGVAPRKTCRVRQSRPGTFMFDLDNPELIRTLSRTQTWPLTLDVCRAIRTLDFKGDRADEIISTTSKANAQRKF